MKDREILEKSIVDHQAAIDVSKKRLAELDKPKLRHGDYGYNYGFPRFFYEDNGEMFVINNEIGIHPELVVIAPKAEYIVAGNIFDDLKRNSEDLERFCVSDRNDKSSFEATKQIDYNSILLEVHRSGLFGLDKAVEISQKLGQLIAYAKRKQK